MPVSNTVSGNNKDLTRMRKILTLLKLSLGAAIITFSAARIVAYIFGFLLGTVTVVLIATAGAVAAFSFLLWEFGVFADKES